jgi:hypothetical protein
MWAFAVAYDSPARWQAMVFGVGVDLLKPLISICDSTHNAGMRQPCLVLLVGATLLFPAPGKKGDNAFTGRWDLTIKTVTATYPSWIEMVDKDGKPAVRLQPRGGSVRPVEEIRLEGTHLTMIISRAAEDRPAITWELNVKNNLITGTVKRGQETQGQIAGQRAPELKNKPPKAWLDPEPLFNGKDLTGWEPGSPTDNHWVARAGELVNEQSGSNLRTTRKFDDFRLHLEFNCPEGGNSGVYLRGRYQVQIEYAAEGLNDKLRGMGSIYGYLAPTRDSPGKSGEWEALDVTLVGRWVTIVHNGVTIIDNQEIPGITGGALDSNEEAPGPFNLQGTHVSGMKFRNIKVSVPKR